MPAYQVDNLISLAGDALVLILITGVAGLWWYSRTKARERLRHKLLDKISSEQMVQLLETETGRRWMLDMFSDHRTSDEMRRQARERTIVLATVAAGCLAFSWASAAALVAGVLCLAAAVGQGIALYFSRSAPASDGPGR